MSTILSIAVFLTLLAALFAIDHWFHRLMDRALFKLVDYLPPYSIWRRYRSRSDPEKYARFRRKSDGS